MLLPEHDEQHLLIPFLALIEIEPPNFNFFLVHVHEASGAMRLLYHQPMYCRIAFILSRTSTNNKEIQTTNGKLVNIVELHLKYDLIVPAVWICE